MKFESRHAFRRLSASLLLAPAMLSLSTSVSAQTAAGDGAAVLEEVVVTATKRGAASVQDVALSIRALGARELQDKGVEDFADWARLVPGLTAEDQGPGEKRYIVRGIRSVGPATVGVYYDDAVVTGFNPEDDGGGRNADIRLYDSERIEVLRGPQGTLYGEGSMSGTIRVITNKPDTESMYGALEGDGAWTEHGGGSAKFNGFINLPATETFAVRAVGWYENESGFVDNVRLGIDDVNDEETYGGRIAARWVPNDRLTIDASYTGQSTELGGKQRYFPSIGELETDEYTVDLYEDDLDIFQLGLDYDLGFGSLHASTAFLDRDVFFRFDSTELLIFFGVPLPFALAVTDQPDHREIWTNEMRFASNLGGRFEYVVGAFYQESKRDFESKVISTDLNGVPNGTEPDIFGRISSFDIDQVAFFGEATFDFTPRVQGLVGLRYFDYSQDSFSMETLPFGGFDPGEEPLPDPARSAGDSDVTYKASLTWFMNDDVHFYGLYSEGFRQGGTNSTGFGNAIVIPEEFEPDTIENYEFGVKTTWLNGGLIANLSVYRIDWDNIQTQEQEPVQGFNFIGNAGKARVEGFEFELFSQLSSQLQLGLGIGYQDARLTEDQPVLEVETPVGRDGDPIPFVPEWTANASLQYDFTISGPWNAYVRADYSFTDSTQTQFNRNGEFYNEQDAYTLLDLRFGMDSGDWRFSVYLDNVFDERAEITIVENRAVPLSIFTNRPRTAGISVRRNF
ncbi:TonB-dependent receptor [Elongatibacter sediminis]|uniref:TonB-dependent receptor n=1 Tax=Elongatibacter sediminis TaxID=3119006 RepID=A0AAW9RBB1_9GAMM